MLDFLNTIEINLLIWIQNQLSNGVFNILMPLITNEKNWLIPIFILIFKLGFQSGKKGKLSLIILIISLALTDAVCAQILKPFFERIRPSHLDIEGFKLLVSKGGKWSMPSNHAANIFSLAAILSYFYHKFTPFLYVLAFSIAFSRVYVGVHFVGDVVVGAIVGYSIAIVVLTFWGIIKLKEIKKNRNWIITD
tara:strand:- start:460 stop:1038 length:579 start_codon:yes stop_codon:yes gene_type:complete